ncbi:MAG: 3'(2'),5'-bisphosphate nucleotidase CysQ [Chitinophagales bacterium]|nr:3'(2'),5'-bisphosphate nucleotidase CysQ [Chitinophagales bacterium]
MNWQEFDLEQIIEIAKDAGKEILNVYDKDFEVDYKDDKSPLTEADKKSNDAIVDALKKAFPEVPIISEEMKEVPFEERNRWDLFWMVDPLDGTKEFIKKNGEFTVNIALVENGIPVAGVVYVPVRDEVYFGKKGEKSFKIGKDGARSELSSGKHYKDLDSIKVVASRSHLSDAVVEFVDELKEKGKKVEFISAGSSLKICLVAEGLADVYPRFGPTMEWDTAAAHAVAEYAGRKVLNAENFTALKYNKENLLNPWFIVE